MSHTQKKGKHYTSLKSKWSQKHADSKKQVWVNHLRSLKWALDSFHPQKLIASSLGSLMLLHVPAASALAMHTITPVYAAASPVHKKVTQQIVIKPAYTVDTLKTAIAQNIPSQYQPLTADQETSLTKTFSQYFGLHVSAELQGIRLNTNYGYIGEEQHLMLYPGDNMAIHFFNSQDATLYAGSGMAPGRGAWGYFADSRQSLTQEDIDREKFYVAIPTFLAPGYDQDVMKYYNFFKYRKLLVVNPDNGKAIVADIADAGPSPYTGKQLGGAPEVMSYLQRVDGRDRGTVLYFFIDDQNNTVPLGPITILH